MDKTTSIRQNTDTNPNVDIEESHPIRKALSQKHV